VALAVPHAGKGRQLVKDIVHGLRPDGLPVFGKHFVKFRFRQYLDFFRVADRQGGDGGAGIEFDNPLLHGLSQHDVQNTKTNIGRIHFKTPLGVRDKPRINHRVCNLVKAHGTESLVQMVFDNALPLLRVTL
jgi:hypothetical protein